MIWFRGRKNCQRISENRRIKRSRESGFSLTRYLLWCVYVIVKGEGFDLYFVTEKPAEQSSAGILRLDTNISRRYYIYFFGAKHLGIRFVDYSMIVATLPEPTVLPPSRIAKRRPCSIATGWISSIVISTLSPGMHISVPSGSSQTPVTSVVLK